MKRIVTLIYFYLWSERVKIEAVLLKGQVEFGANNLGAATKDKVFK